MRQISRTDDQLKNPAEHQRKNPISILNRICFNIIVSFKVTNLEQCISEVGHVPYLMVYLREILFKDS